MPDAAKPLGGTLVVARPLPTEVVVVFVANAGLVRTPEPPRVGMVVALSKPTVGPGVTSTNPITPGPEVFDPGPLSAKLPTGVNVAPAVVPLIEVVGVSVGTNEGFGVVKNSVVVVPAGVGAKSL